MLDTIPVFDNRLPVQDLVNDLSPLMFTANNKELGKKFVIYPYIAHGKFYEPPNNKHWASNGLIEKIFRLKSEIYHNNEDVLQRIFKPDMYDYDFNTIRQVIIDVNDNNILAETGSIKIFKGQDFSKVIKLNHRWYMSQQYRDDYLRNRKVLGFNHQSHVKQQWLLGKNMGAEIMYETRKKSNSLWKINFKIDGDFFNEDNGWFYTENRFNIRNFDGWPLIWYDKEKYTKESALEYLSKL